MRKMISLGRILVGIDGSEQSRTAADYAAYIAKRFGAYVCLLNVYSIPSPAMTEPHKK